MGTKALTFSLLLVGCSSGGHEEFLGIDPIATPPETGSVNPGVTVVGQPRWAVRLGGLGFDRGMITAVDSAGDVIVAGGFDGYGERPEAFITKRAANDGSERWTGRLAGSSSPSLWVVIDAMAITLQDEVVITGAYGGCGSADFGGQSLAIQSADCGASDMFVAKYGSGGALLWVRGAAENSNAHGTALAVDASGSIYVGARFLTTSFVLADGQAYQETDGDADALLLAYASDGTLRWAQGFQGASGPYPRSLAIAANGDVLLAGELGAPASLGGAILDPAATSRGFLTRFHADGGYVASAAVGPLAPYVSLDPHIQVDTAGHIVLQQTEYEPQPPFSGQRKGTTIHVLDDVAQELWSANLTNDGAYSEQSRTLVTTGGLIASAAWADAPYNADHPASVQGAMEVVTFAADGSSAAATFGSRLRGAPVWTAAWASAVSSTGAIAYTGEFGGAIDFGTGVLATQGDVDDVDAFIVVVEPPVAAH